MSDIDLLREENKNLRDILEKIIHLAAQGNVANIWKDISTAPKKAHHLILIAAKEYKVIELDGMYKKDGYKFNVLVGVYNDKMDCWSDAIKLHRMGRNTKGHGSKIHNAAYWRPLPIPPSEE